MTETPEKCCEDLRVVTMGFKKKTEKFTRRKQKIYTFESLLESTARTPQPPCGDPPDQEGK